MKDLRAIAGAEHVLADPPAHRLADAADPAFLPARADWLVAPGTAEEVAEVLAWCSVRGIPVTSRGGGTGLAGGAVPEHGGVALELRRLRAIRAHVPEERRLHVEAGLRTAEVRRLAEENGLVFGPDPGGAESSQIGGNVATNAGGPHSYGLGTTREHLTGLEVALPGGELLTLGGALPRDATGLDLVGLLAGSEGTLGVITAVELRLRPAPARPAGLKARFPDAHLGTEAVRTIIAAGLQTNVLDFLDEHTPGAEGAFVLLLEPDGDPAELEAALAPSAADVERLEARALARWREQVHGRAKAHRGTKRSDDIAVPVPRLADAIEGIARIGAEHRLEACSWGHAGDGILHASFLLDLEDGDAHKRAGNAAERVLELALHLGGRPSGEHGTGRLKRAWRDRALGPGASALTARVKAAFDPGAILNPGVG